MTKLDKATLLANLQAFAAELGETPTRTQMNDDGPHSSTPYYTQWGSWNAALEAAGLTTNHENEISKDRLVAELQRLDTELDRLPRFEDMDEHGTFSGHTYLRTFGSWGDAKDAAGLDRRRRTNRRLSRVDLVDAMCELAQELGKTPTQTEMADYGRYSQRPYYREWDSWNEAVQAAGLDPEHDRGTPKDALLGELERLVDELGRTPTFAEMNERGRYSVFPYLRAFGTWNDALRAAGLSINKAHGVVIGHLDYGSNWERQRQKTLERDNYECQHCGLTNAEHEAEWNQGLHIHHRVKRRKFDDHRNANRLENLVTLCRDCHYDAES
ncbi:HNH endonuclease [Halogranum rubrum]|uniref:HNH endonuclease n=1 Tax=Halogranum rubrum TaxID=553466 RepID=A0A1I4BFC1_9EURY|nr:HNH endonuclease [Halogranum rubrum]SFK67562.1 HNH endonuclease [Halogranum rubrum]